MSTEALTEGRSQLTPIGDSWRAHWPAGLVLAAFVLLGVLYNVTNPIFEAPDEVQHFHYIDHLSRGQGLPVQGEDGESAWAQEGSQPPLYYLLGSLVMLASDTRASDVAQVIWLNPQANVGDPLYPGNKNHIVHTDQESFPYHGTARAVHLLRLFSLALGAGTVLFTYLIAREALRRQDLATLAAAFVAFNPQFLFISSAVSNDNLVTFLSAVTLWALLRMIAGPNPMRHAVLVGCATGFAILAKLSGLTLLPLVGVGLGMLWLRERSWRRVATLGVVIGVLAAGIAGWWFVRNWVLYRSVLGLDPMLGIVGLRDDSPTMQGIWSEFEGLRISFWALFGWFNIPVPRIIYRVLDAAMVLGGLGLIWGAIRRARGGLVAWSGWWRHALLALWILAFSVSLVRWTTLTMGSQGRLLFPTIAAFMVLLVLGLAQWMPRRWQTPGLSGLAGGLFAFAALCPFLVIVPAYARPPLIGLEDVPAEAAIAPLDHIGKIRLLGYETDRQQVHPGDYLGVSLYWQCLEPMDEDYNVYIRVLGRNNQVVGQVDTYPGWGSYPTTLWSAGQVIKDTYQVPITYMAVVPSRGRIDVGFYTLEDKVGLPVYDGEGKVTEGVIGSVAVVPDASIDYHMESATDYRLGDEVMLAGYDLEDDQARAGGHLYLTLYWKACSRPSADYTVFVHLVDEEDRIWSQHDKQPLHGSYPTSMWRDGDVVKDEYLLLLDRHTPPGEYWIEVGMYLREDAAQRLPLVDEAGQYVDTRILLTPVGVAGPGAASVTRGEHE